MGREKPTTFAILSQLLGHDPRSRRQRMIRSTAVSFRSSSYGKCHDDKTGTAYSRASPSIGKPHEVALGVGRLSGGGPITPYEEERPAGPHTLTHYRYCQAVMKARSGW
jgi:hypothetical protein